MPDTLGKRVRRRIAPLYCRREGLDMLLVGLRKTVAENQIFSELAEAKYPISEK